MPYNSVDDLPANVKDHLPGHAQEIYIKAFNSAWKEYSDSNKRMAGSSQEETAYRIAWAAVKKVYEKDELTGQWKRKRSKVPA